MRSKKVAMVKLKRRDFVITGLGLGALSAAAGYSYHLGGQEFFNRYMAVVIVIIGLCMLVGGLHRWRLLRKAAINKEGKRG